MRLIRISIATTLFLSWAFAQSGANRVTGKAVYFLEDDLHKQWCGYASQSQFKAEVQSLKAMVVGGADYANGRVSRVRVTETDETGDWAVNDEYTFDKNERIQTLKRTTNILPEDTSEEQLFLIENGKAVKQRSTYRELRTGKATQKTVDWFHAPPVITNIRAFPFSPLIGSKRFEIWSKGEACTHVSQP
jgi:hypothetical protein